MVGFSFFAPHTLTLVRSLPFSGLGLHELVKERVGAELSDRMGFL